jgi:hypothetical protein
MGIDRSKFKAAPISAMKKLDGDLGQRRGYANYERVGYHIIDDGDNKFRIYPAHPDCPDGVFWHPKSTAFLSLETELRDKDGEPTGETEIKRRPVYTSDVHGPPDLSGKDLIKMYIEFAKIQFEKMFETEEEQKTAADIMYNWRTGISPKLTWIMYADKYDTKGQKSLAFLELGNGVKKKVNDLASEMDTGDSPIAVDPFTDPEDGIALIITKQGEKLATSYKVDFDKTKKGKFNVELNPTPLTDEDLEKFLKFEPLHKRYKNNFRRKDFELQKEGLMRFDTENEFFFFENEEWIGIVEDMQELVYAVIAEEKHEDKEGSEEKGEQEEKPKKPTDKLPFDSKKEHTAKVLKKASVVKETPKVEQELEEDDDPEEKEQEEEETKEKVDVQDRLAAIRARLAANKK